MYTQPVSACLIRCRRCHSLSLFACYSNPGRPPPPRTRQSDRTNPSRGKAICAVATKPSGNRPSSPTKLSVHSHLTAAGPHFRRCRCIGEQNPRKSVSCSDPLGLNSVIQLTRTKPSQTYIKTPKAHLAFNPSIISHPPLTNSAAWPCLRPASSEQGYGLGELPYPRCSEKGCRSYCHLP